MIQNLLAVFRIFMMIFWTFIIIPPLIIVKRINAPAGLKMAMWWHIMMCKSVGLKVKINGDICTNAPVLYVSNHVSYLDIVVIGSKLSGWFVAKKEVEKWPVFGFLSKCQNTLFIERNPRKAAEQQDSLAKALKSCNNLILFPEGTSANGNRVLPFKSTLFSVARLIEQTEQLNIQPVTIAYTHIDGIPVRRVHRPLFTWFGDMEMASHLWQFLKQGNTTVQLTLHAPVARQDFDNRKTLSQYCQQQVASGYQA